MDIISCPLSFSTSALNFLKTLKTTNFFLQKNVHFFLEKSSMKIKKYLFLPNELEVIGPHTLVWISSCGLLALEVNFIGKLLLNCFSSKHHLQS